MAKINYLIKIIPIGDDRPEFNIDNSTLDITVDNYGIENLKIVYNILQPKANMAIITLLDIYACKNKFGQSNLYNNIRKGDIVQIYENNDEIELLIFIGSINNIKSMSSINNDYVSLQCYNLLQQLSMQNCIKPITQLSQLNNDQNHEFTEWLQPNVSPLKNTLSNLFDGTLIQYAYEKQYIESISGVTDKINPYAFVNATGSLKGALSLNDIVLIALSPTMKKTEALSNILQIYQYIYYQDQFGIVRIQPLSTKNTAASIYDFSLEKNISTYAPYKSVLFNDNIVLNEVIVTGVNAGAIDIELSSMAQVKNGLFQREYDLLQTGYFTNLQIDVQNLPTSVTQNTDILNIWYNSQGKGNPNINVGNSIVSSTQTIDGNKAVNQVLQLISSRELCQSLMNGSAIIVETKRDFSVGQELPFGKMINFNSAGRTSPDFNQGLCIECTLTWGNGITDLSYQLIKPFTYTAIWDE